MEKQPNVIMIAIDCLRSDRIFAKNRSCKTPNIDKLVKKGCSFNNVFVENSITAPSFSSMFTGRYAGNHGVIGMVGVKMDEEIPTMAELFAASGYETYAEVTGPLNPILGVDRGFSNYNFRSQHDYYFNDWGKELLEKLKGDHFDPPYFLLVHFWEAHVPRQVQPEFDRPKFGRTAYDRSISGLDSYIGQLVEAAGEDCAIILTGDHGEAIGEVPADNTLLPYFLDKLNLPPIGTDTAESIDDVTDLMKEEPLLHQFAADLSKATSKDGKKIGLWQRLVMMFNLLKIGISRYKIQLKKGIKGSFFKNLKQKLNDTMIFLSVLAGKPEAAQTQMVRSSLEEHKLQHGYHIYDYLQKVPIVFCNPDIFPENKMVEAEVRHIDLLPTMIEAFKLEQPADGIEFDGSSYFDYMTKGTGADRPVYLEARGGAQAEKVFLIRGVRRGGQKVAYAPYEEKAPIEFYEMANDKIEIKNLANKKAEEIKPMKEEGEAIAAAFRAGTGNTLSAKENMEMVKKLKSLGYM